MGVDSFPPSPAALKSACLLTLDSLFGVVDSTTLRIRWEVATHRTGQYEGADFDVSLEYIRLIAVVVLVTCGNRGQCG